MEAEAPPVVCVLGCKATSAALLRRSRAGARAFRDRNAGLVVACGGRSWDGLVEADAIATILAERGVPPEAIVRERCSLDTRDNARFAAALLSRRGISSVVLVTCEWHLPRARRAFESVGLTVEGHGVAPPDPSLRQRAYWFARERLSSWNDSRRSSRIA